MLRSVNLFIDLLIYIGFNKEEKMRERWVKKYGECYGQYNSRDDS